LKVIALNYTLKVGTSLGQSSETACLQLVCSVLLRSPVFSNSSNDIDVLITQGWFSSNESPALDKSSALLK